MLWVEAVFVLSDVCGKVATSCESELCGCWYLQDTGATPLYVASQEGHDVVVTALLASGAAVNQARTVGAGC